MHHSPLFPVQYLPAYILRLLCWLVMWTPSLLFSVCSSLCATPLSTSPVPSKPSSRLRCGGPALNSTTGKLEIFAIIYCNLYHSVPNHIWLTSHNFLSPVIWSVEKRHVWAIFDTCYNLSCVHKSVALHWSPCDAPQVALNPRRRILCLHHVHVQCALRSHSHGHRHCCLQVHWT